MKITLKNATVYHGSNLDVLPTLPDNSVDSIVTDPPYELGFMGKSWDNSGIAYSVELWTECMRVLKPGGHLLAFGGSRTWHRLAVAIEDAGFEMRDSIAWLYGSGFPKSLDISKAIDKTNGEGGRLRKFTEFMQTTGLTAKQLNDVTGTSMGGHYLTAASQPAIPTPELWGKIRPLIAEVPAWVDELVERIEAEREVIGQKTAGMGSGKTFGMLQAEGQNQEAEKTLDITAPATPEAKQWQGWGTALKPAFEPVVVARKPLIGTVAENVLTYGTGGLNIDGSRIGTDGGTKRDGLGVRPDENDAGFRVGHQIEQLNAGRWPANIILDPYTAELLDEQQEEVSRFFYVAKASKKDRNEGLDALQETSAGEMVERKEGSAGMNSPRAGAGRTSGAKNFHPTVKPTALMEYLIKLVTPSGGTVLDPFTGSGSTGKAALLNGFQFIGIELTEDYLPIIEGRLTWANAQASQTEEEKKETLF